VETATTQPPTQATPTASPAEIAPAEVPRVATAAVDEWASSALRDHGIVVHDVMLNQADLSDNKNKFFKLQLVKTTILSSKNNDDDNDEEFHVFARWGRVGDRGLAAEQGGYDSSVGEKEFAKKFRSKTGNKWEDYDSDPLSFAPKKGKYTVLETVAKEETNRHSGKAKTVPSALDPTTKELIDFVFDNDTLLSAMSDLGLDTKRLPLGTLSRAQIAKGYSVLENLRDELLSSSVTDERCTELSSEFYTLIPHAFGRQRGPLLDDEAAIDAKFEMLNVLSDIEATQRMQNESEAPENNKTTTPSSPHRSDQNYGRLSTELTLLDPESDEEDLRMIQDYFDESRNNVRGSRPVSLRHAWRVNRHGEGDRFDELHGDISERRLLWHGTNVAVVAAVLKEGLRIMPHSGGRVGKGIYLADLYSKSELFSRPQKKAGVGMLSVVFLVEAALGKSFVITNDDRGLTEAPPGYDSVWARGTVGPPELKEWYLDGRPVMVPCGNVETFDVASSFRENEFLLYEESQHRIRYVVTFQTSEW